MVTISPTYLFIWKKITFVGLCAAFWSIFLRIKLLSDHPCKSHNHDHQWAVLVMAWKWRKLSTALWCATSITGLLNKLSCKTLEWWRLQIQVTVLNKIHHNIIKISPPVVASYKSGTINSKFNAKTTSMPTPITPVPFAYGTSLHTSHWAVKAQPLTHPLQIDIT